jgi:spoIIIJ-associated protein
MVLTKKNKKDSDLVKTIAEKLLELMSIEAGVEVDEDKENDALLVRIDSAKEAGLIIGSRGKTLNSLQVLLGMIYKKKYGNWRRIIVDVSGWRDKEKERLINLATLTEERAKETGEPQYLYNLTSSQRRIIHLFLAEKPGVKTESLGENKDRYLIVTSTK